jgi:cytochrome bd-type quinol oxidase subunit 2
VVSEVSHFAAHRQFNVPPLISFLLVGFLLLFVTQLLYFKLKKSRKSEEIEGIPWPHISTAFLTTLIPVLAYAVIRVGKVAEREWLAFFYVSVLFAILIPHLIVRLYFLVRPVRLRESSEAARKESLC